MSTNQPSLFGTYPWSVGTTSSPTLYGTGYVPQTFSVTLSENVTGTESELFNTVKVLAESMSLTDAQTKALTKILADSTTASDAVAKTIAKVLADSASVSDSSVAILTIKDLSDFLILKEWISIRLQKSVTWLNPGTSSATWAGPGPAPVPVWINPQTNENIFDTLWGKYQYGRVLFGGLKPLATWTEGSRRQSPWTNDNGHKYNS